MFKGLKEFQISLLFKSIVLISEHSNGNTVALDFGCREAENIHLKMDYIDLNKLI